MAAVMLETWGSRGGVPMSHVGFLSFFLEILFILG